MLERLLARTEERALSFQTIWGAGDTYALSTKAGTVVTQETAMRIGTVYACVRLISDSISKPRRKPHHVVDPKPDGSRD